MAMGSGGAPWLVIAEITLFWTASVVHVLRLLARPWVPDADPVSDAGHAVMGAGMVFAVFPGAPAAVGRVLACGFVVLTGVFAVRAVHSDGSGRGGGFRDTAIAVSQAAMAVMLMGVGRLPVWVTVSFAAVLAACAAVHGRRLPMAHRLVRACPSDGSGRQRVLVTLPHAGAVATTLAMSVTFAAM
ncbi:MAG: DUF5134 domain-containing protein [Catenulispora sp.]